MESTIENDQDFANTVLNNFMGLFFVPEINQRKTLGLITEEFCLLKAQAIIFPNGSPTLIRINDEVQAEIVLKPGVDSTADSFSPSANEVITFKLCEPELMNCGHVTLIYLNEGYKLTFDFQYNSQICKDHLKVAEQFLNTSLYALENSYTFSFIDNSFSAIELLAKTNLLLEANQNVVGKTNHNTIKQAFNNRLRDSELDFEVAQRTVFNRLSDIRSRARYLNGELSIELNELTSIYNTIKEMLSNLIDRLQYTNPVHYGV